jgi:hypothetical protein
MIVYGDRSYEEDLGTLVRELRLHAESCHGTSSLDELRNLLVHAGQVEQAVADGLESRSAEFETMTDAAAEAFLTRQTEPLRQILRSCRPVDARVQVKLPEGFVSYNLFPEAYDFASHKWLSDHASGTIVVIGIRTIGTTLSAVVAASLRAAGRNVRRFTIRPSGSPFERVATIDPDDVQGADWALVVDEGPGLSGSSMVSVGKALVAAGIPRERISFFPGHEGEPGEKASEEVRRWWKATPRYVCGVGDLKWAGKTLTESLANATEDLCLGLVESIEDVSSGWWREFAYETRASWPAVITAQERAKFLAILRDGRAVLWKYEGIAVPDGRRSTAEIVFDTLVARAKQGWTPAPLATAFGFVATPWIEGTRLASSDAAPDVVAAIGRYIAAVSGPPLSRAEHRESLARLTEMGRLNVSEALGGGAPPRFASPRTPCTASCGDGAQAPHEWIRTADGHLYKVDSAGHEWEPTVIGRQSIEWDIAGAITEWDLSAAQSDALLFEIESAGIRVDRQSLHWYCLCYAAFKFGRFALSGTPPDRWRTRMERLIGSFAYIG